MNFLENMLPSRFLLHIDAGSVLARMVLRYQMKNISEDRSGACSDLNFSEDGMDKNYDWNFIPDPLVDSVFPLNDDIDSEGKCFLFFNFFSYYSRSVAYWGLAITMNSFKLYRKL